MGNLSRSCRERQLVSGLQAAVLQLKGTEESDLGPDTESGSVCDTWGCSLTRCQDRVESSSVQAVFKLSRGPMCFPYLVQSHHLDSSQLSRLDLRPARTMEFSLQFCCEVGDCWAFPLSVSWQGGALPSWGAGTRVTLAWFLPLCWLSEFLYSWGFHHFVLWHSISCKYRSFIVILVLLCGKGACRSHPFSYSAYSRK